MNSNEILKELEMSYNELVEYLLKKYGAAQYDYFHNSNCKSKNKKTSRTKEGLFCHHIDEDKACALCHPEAARLYPFSYQQAERLVYCNYLEHLMMHIQIGKDKYWNDYTELKNPKEFSYFITPGVKWISEEINDLFDKNGSTIEWRNRCFEEIKDNFEDYVYILRTFIKYIGEKYIETIGKIVEIGKHIKHEKYGNGIITNVDTFGFVTIEFEKDKIQIPYNRDYQKGIDSVRNKLSTDRDQKTIKLIYERII